MKFLRKATVDTRKPSVRPRCQMVQITYNQVATIQISEDYKRLQKKMKMTKFFTTTYIISLRHNISQTTKFSELAPKNQILKTNE